MDPLPEKRRWRAFPRFPLIDDGLTGGADQARESSLADVEVSAQRFELNVIVLGNGGPGQWHWRGPRAATPAVAPDQVRRNAAFVQKHQARGVEARGGRPPLLASRRDVRPIVFGRAYGFFFTVNPSRPTIRQMVVRLAVRP